MWLSGSDRVTVDSALDVVDAMVAVLAAAADGPASSGLLATADGGEDAPLPLPLPLSLLLLMRPCSGTRRSNALKSSGTKSGRNILCKYVSCT